MVERVSIIDPQTAANLAREYDARNTSGAPNVGSLVTSRDVTNEKYSVTGLGEVKQLRREVGSASALPDGMVQLENGQIVSKETAKLNKWICEEPNGEITTIDPAFKANPEQSRQGQKKQDAPTDEIKKQFAASDKLLDDIEGRTNAEQRSSAANTFINDGDIRSGQGARCK